MSEPTAKQWEWQDAATHRVPKWPLLGYAPGKYSGRCVICEGRFMNMDKRAWNCLPCAIEAATDATAGQHARMLDLKAENEALRAAIRIVQPSEPAAIRQSKEPVE